MILELENWYYGYSQILEDCRSSTSGSNCLVLCGMDVDAIAAARILTYMLRADQVEYTLRPCASLASLEQVMNNSNNSNNNNNYAAIVLLNLGGTRNLTNFFGNNNNNNNDNTATKLYVMDGRRPLHLANVYADSQVVLFWDPTCLQDDTELPSDGDNLSGKSDSSDSESDSEEESSSTDSDDFSDEEELADDDQENEMELDTNITATNNNNDTNTTNLQPRPEPRSPQPQDDDDDNMDYDGEDEADPDGRITPQKKKTTNKKLKSKTTTTATRDLGLEDSDDEQEEAATSPATQATAATEGSFTQTDTQATTTTTTANLPTLTPAERHAQRQDRLRLYYSKGHSHGTPASYIVWTLATQLRFGQNADLLWLALVGVTDCYLANKIDRLAYSALAHALADHVVALFPPQDVYERVDATVYAEELLVSQGNNASTANKTKLTFSEQGRIVSQSDVRLFLLRHTSLFQALSLSNYVSTQLQLWTKPGMLRLQELLARMGFPLDASQQPFSFMKPTLRRRLQAELAEYMEEFNLDELKFTSFVRVTGFSSLTSASDVCYAASALLECPTVSAADTDPSSDWDMDCFHAAYDCLGSMGTTKTTSVTGSNTTVNPMQVGLDYAVKLQRIILNKAVELVTRNAITRLRHFRYAYISCTNSQSAHPGEADLLANSGGNPQENGTGINGGSNKQKYHVLAKPLALTRLAHYLMDMHRSNGKWVGDPNKIRPLVLLAENPATSTYLVVGCEMAAEPGQLTPNKLGQVFATVAASLGNVDPDNELNNNNNNHASDDDDSNAPPKPVVRLESFDAHVVEVAATHAQRFLEQLHYIMDSV